VQTGEADSCDYVQQTVAATKQWRQRCVNDKANKRLQISKALEDGHVKTDITVLADDDFEWPSTLMPWLLTPFEDDRMAGLGRASG
jgi:hypothetical protein